MEDKLPCRNCGPVQDRIGVLKQVIHHTAAAHEMMANLYTTLAKDLPKESEAFVKAAAHQMFLAVESRKAVLPDEINPGDDETPLAGVDTSIPEDDGDIL